MKPEAVLESLEGQKARGAFFTPPDISRFMTEWALRSSEDRVLEPSCGEAAFLLPAAIRLRQLGALELELTAQLDGMDIHPASIAEAGRLLGRQGFNARLAVGDFFSHPAEPIYDAVIGNPPYVRYQNFRGEARRGSVEAALRQGVRLNQLASSWAAFTVHASAFLRPQGRLALVLPAELLSVKYAAPVRRYLLNRFASVRLVLFENLVFPGVLEEVVLLLAEGSGGAQRFEVHQARDASDLVKGVAADWTEFNPRGDDKWTGALLPSQAYALYDEMIAGGAFDALRDWGKPSLGAVTGNNAFFALGRSQMQAWGLSADQVVKVSPPGSRHFRGIEFSAADWQALEAANARCYLFAPSATPSEASLRYIEDGAARGVPDAYKCQMRYPWWQVPRARRPDLLLTYMNHDAPRLIRNSAEVEIFNSLYGVSLHQERRVLGRELLPWACLNTLTSLGAEIVGRTYGGGMLKHEPSEAERIPVPSFESLAAVGPALRRQEKKLTAMLANNESAQVIDVVDHLLLRDHLGVAATTLEALRRSRRLLQQRRQTRGRRGWQHGKD